MKKLFVTAFSFGLLACGAQSLCMNKSLVNLKQEALKAKQAYESQKEQHESSFSFLVIQYQQEGDYTEMLSSEAQKKIEKKARKESKPSLQSVETLKEKADAAQKCYDAAKLEDEKKDNHEGEEVKSFWYWHYNNHLV